MTITYNKGMLHENVVQCEYQAAYFCKVLLGHSHPHLLMYCLWLLSHYKGRVG